MGYVHRFNADHQDRQRLILRALEEMNSSAETPEDSALITEMIVELEKLLASRSRSYSRRRISYKKTRTKSYAVARMRT